MESQKVPQEMVLKGGVVSMNKGVVFEGWVDPVLSQDQKEVLDMIINDNEIPRRIALRRKTSKEAVNKIIRKLKAKGFLKGRFDGGVVKGDPLPRWGGCQRDTQTTLTSYGKHVIRLHGQEFNAKILFRSAIYDRTRAATPKLQIQGCTVRLFPRSLEIYCDKSRSFLGASAMEALRSSQPYWDRVFRDIEAHLGILLIKPGHAPTQVNAHFAELQNELADQAIKEDKIINLPDPKDSKTWLLVDYSKREPELETIHPKSALMDMQEVVQPFFDDLRSYYARTGERLILSDFLKGMDSLAANQAVFDANMKSHIGAVQALGKAVNEFRELIDKKLK